MPVDAFTSCGALNRRRFSAALALSPLAAALPALGGKPVSLATTRAYGCSVKYRSA